MIKFYAEIGRKLIHLSSLWISLLYFYTDKELMLFILVPLSIFSILIDLSRRFLPKFHQCVNNIIGFMMREEEKDEFAIVGATYLLISAALTIFFFNKEIAIFALAVLSISDACAALIGRKFGRTTLINGKTLEGSVAFFVSALLVYLFLTIYCSFKLPFINSFIAILSATFIELFAKKIRLDDNFTIPLVVAFILSF